MTDSIADMNWPSFSGAAEDRNGEAWECVIRLALVADASEVAEDRNTSAGAVKTGAVDWRSPFGAVKDRNNRSVADEAIEAQLAVALRGDRGSQRPRPAPADRGHPDWRSPSGTTKNRNFPVLPLQVGDSQAGGRPPATEDRNHCGVIVRDWPGVTGGRPPGRPRIAT